MLRSHVPGNEIECSVSFDDMEENSDNDLPSCYVRRFYVFGAQDTYEAVTVFVDKEDAEVEGDPYILGRSGEAMTLDEVEQAARTWAAIAEFARSARDTPDSIRSLFHGKDLPKATP